MADSLWSFNPGGAGVVECCDDACCVAAYVTLTLCSGTYATLANTGSFTVNESGTDNIIAGPITVGDRATGVVRLPSKGTYDFVGTFPGVATKARKRVDLVCGLNNVDLRSGPIVEIQVIGCEGQKVTGVSEVYSQNVNTGAKIYALTDATGKAKLSVDGLGNYQFGISSLSNPRFGPYLTPTSHSMFSCTDYSVTVNPVPATDYHCLTWSHYGVGHPLLNTRCMNPLPRVLHLTDSNYGSVELVWDGGFPDWGSNYWYGEMLLHHAACMGCPELTSKLRWGFNPATNQNIGSFPIVTDHGALYHTAHQLRGYWPNWPNGTEGADHCPGDAAQMQHLVQGIYRDSHICPPGFVFTFTIYHVGQNYGCGPVSTVTITE